MSEPLTIIFKATPTARGLGLLVGCGFALVGGVLSLVAGGLGAVMLAAANRNPDAKGAAYQFLCCGLPFGLLFLAIGLYVAWTAGRGGGAELVLDAERITYGETSLTIARITTVGARQGRQGRVPYWAVVMSDDQASLELEVTQDRYIGTFDVRAILRALLPRLPETCVVEPRVRGYAEGQPLG